MCVGAILRDVACARADTPEVVHPLHINTETQHAMQHAHTHTHVRSGSHGEDENPSVHRHMGQEQPLTAWRMPSPDEWLQPCGEWGCSARYHHADGCGDGRCPPW
jgi:hypothetical protein